MANSMAGASKDRLWFSAGAVICLMLLSSAASAAPPGRLIVADGTVKAADGQRLHGMSLHISKSYSSANLTWGLDKQNLIDVRDRLHMNCIRLLCLDPRAVKDGRPDRAFATIEEEAYYTDSVIANAGEVGINIILNYHCLMVVTDGGAWDIRNFWEFYAPRYKDRTWVAYEIENEPWQHPPNSPGAVWNPSDAPSLSLEVELYKTVRTAAPDAMILVGYEPVCVTDNWASYLKDVYAPAAGFSFASGKDAWPWHPYQNTNSASILATQADGIPMIMTECSYPEEGDNNAIIDGYHYPAEWCERNGISWTDWHRWNRADQLSTPLNYLIPDAESKGWAWWGNDVGVESVPVTVRAIAEKSPSAVSITANGRVMGRQATQSKGKRLSENGRYRLWVLPDAR